MPKIKICGLTCKEDIELINDFPVDYAGFVLYFPKSKRNITIEQAQQLKAGLKKSVQAVAVTVSPDLEQVKAIAAAGFSGIQIHGILDKEVEEYLNIPIFRAVNVTCSEDIKAAQRNLKEKIKYIVFDGKQSGSGETFDWGFLQNNVDNSVRIMLAGGLTEHNVDEAIRKFYPAVVDVSSSVEKEDGTGKDREKISRFIKAVFNSQKKADEGRKDDQSMSTYYGEFGGQYVAESLMNTLQEVDQAFEEAIHDPEFWKEFYYYMKEYVGRETPLYLAERLSEKYGPKIYLKREDLNHTGAHKINNVIGQILLAKRMGKKKVIAETGAGQHGVATATGAALFDMECKVFMGEEDIKRQELNVLRMKMLGSSVNSVTSGSRTLKDATNEAIRTWAKEAEDTFYVIGSAVGPYPYPKIVKTFQSVISKEARRQILEKEGRLPDTVMACVGGGSNSIGMFAEFLDDKDVKLVGVEAAGLGIETGKHASAMALGKPGVLHGMRSYLLQDEDGNVQLAHSISAGLDYPGVGPEHAFLKDSGRVEYVSVTDDEAMNALLELCKMEGIIPAIESSHALAYLLKYAKQCPKDEVIVMCLSGRGDKDCHTIQAWLEGNKESLNK